jgi:xanthine/uracil permease
LGGIGTATLAAILLNLFLNRGEETVAKVQSVESEANNSVVQGS